MPIQSHTYVEEKSNNPRGLGIFSLVLFLVSILLAFPSMNTAMQYMIEETLRSGRDYLVFLLPVMLISCCIQIWLLNKQRWFCWLLPGFSAALIVVAELYWLQGGWESLGSGFFWIVGFPMMLGNSIAIILWMTMRTKQSVRIVIMMLMVAVVAVGSWLWPRYLNEKIDITPEAKVLYFEPGDTCEWMQVKDSNRIGELLNWIKVSPCLSSPDWDEERGIIIRLDEMYILIANQNDTPYIYEYTGELDEFDGSNPKWVVFGYPALYGELRACLKTVGK